MDEKIIKLLEVLYGISEEEKTEFLSMIENMDEQSKKNFALALYKRYESYKSSLQELDTKLQFISNDLWDIGDKLEAEKMEF